MSSLLLRRAESPQPDLDTTSSASVSTASKAESPLHRISDGRSIGRSSKSSFCEDDPILCERSDVGVDWSREEQEQFISYLLLHTEGKQLSGEEIQLIRSEVQKAGLPMECVDRLIEENDRHNQQQEQLLNMHTKDVFEAIEDVDESDNILAYFLACQH